MLDEYKDIQPIVYNILCNEISNNKLNHAYLFDVSNYQHSFPFIVAFIKTILCPNNYTNNSKCQKCSLCSTIDDNNFPDIKIIYPDGLWIKKDQLLELQKEFSTKSIYDNKKIYIINYAENLNQSSANSILKFLEEPSSNIIAILLTKSINNVLPTIISRCQLIHFIPEKVDNDDFKLKLGHAIFDSNDEYQNFINSDNLQIDELINFMIYNEKNGIDTLNHTHKLWFNYFNDKTKNIFAYNVMLLFYKDVVNKKLNRKLDLFDSYLTQIDEISLHNTINQLYSKINLIIDTLDKNKININLSLNLDNLIIRMEEVK